MEKQELIQKTETGLTVLSSAVEQKLNYFENISTEETAFKNLLLEVLLENDISMTKCGEYTISQVVPKNTIIFNKDSFIENVSDEMLTEFGKIETITKPFNLEKFKTENPELYEKYCETTEEFVIDEKKLSKAMPETYKKYCTEVKSDKKITLRIAKAKKA